LQCHRSKYSIVFLLRSCISLVNMVKFRTNRVRLTEVPSLFMSSLRATQDAGCLPLSENSWEFSFKSRQYSRKNVRPTSKLLFALPSLCFSSLSDCLSDLSTANGPDFRFSIYFPSLFSLSLSLSLSLFLFYLVMNGLLTILTVP